MAKSTFEKNGGYFIDGVAYMDCKITGEPVPNVSTEAVSVIGSRALMGRMFKQFPELLNQHTNLQVVLLVGIGWLSL